MEYYAGLDVSLELTAICVVDGSGKILAENKIPSDPQALAAYLNGLGIVDSHVMSRLANIPNILLWNPLDYRDFLHVLTHAELAIADSGGIQEEASSFGVPLIGVRRVTERPEGIRAGFARLISPDMETIVSVASKWLKANRHIQLKGRPNPYGDGRAAERIIASLREEQ